jgi:hypothetical protein
MNKLFSPEWNWFGALRNAEGAEGGGAGAADAAAGAGDVASTEAQAESPVDAPASTFLTEAAKPAEGETKVPPESEPKVEGEAPAAFDLAAIKLPEGFELSEETGKLFSEVLGNDKLSPQERGQQLLDLHTKTLGDMQTAMQEQMATQSRETWTKMNDEWRGQIKDLPEFKANPDAEAGKILQALKAVGADESFFAAMDLTGAGNHPVVMQVLHRLAKPFLEGGAVVGSGKTAPARQLGANIYTSSQS